MDRSVSVQGFNMRLWEHSRTLNLKIKLVVMSRMQLECQEPGFAFPFWPAVVLACTEGS